MTAQCILVTRPRPEGETLCMALQAEGFEALFFPLLEIKALSSEELHQQITQLDSFDWLIFVSRHAVRHSATLIHQQWPRFPEGVRVAAVGKGTAEALQEAALPLAVYPQHWNSEGLLALADFQAVAKKKIAIFCGQGGRDLLINVLKSRGAEVTQLICYQRLLPTLDLAAAQKLIQPVDVILCTSVQSLLHLQQLFPFPEVKKIPLVLVSERIMIQAQQLGFEQCFMAQDASHQNMIKALKMIRNKADV